MNLIVDLGNTLSKVALFEDEVLINVKKFHKDQIKTLVEYLKSLDYKKSIISSVIKTPEEIISQIKSKTESIIYFDSTTKLPISNKYATPKSLGYDRLALAVGGYARFPKTNVLIIDAGTCITYDIINKNGEYLGGAISPGLDMRFESLGKFTDNLPILNKSDIDYTIGSTTDESIRSGVENGIIFEIKGFISEFKKKFTRLTIILSGGDSIFLSKKLKNCKFVDSNFQLYGLNKILIFNANQ